MKIVNPVGRTPGNSELNAYACVCNTTGSQARPHATLMGNIPCNVCAYECDPSISGNSAANENQARWRLTQ